MPRQTIIKSFAFIPAMEDWETKDPPVDVDAKTKEEEKTAEPDSGNDDFFFSGGGDLVDAVEDANIQEYNLRSYYIPLASMKSLFYVFVPFVAMGDDFKAITEEDLELFQLTPTIDFTLSLNLRFHGDKNRLSTKMFDRLSNIRFLKELKMSERVSAEDFKQVAGLHFLTSLQLSDINQITDDALVHLHGLVNLEKLVIQRWQRLTSKGVQEIPKIAPNLHELVLIDNENLTVTHRPLNAMAFATFPSSPSLIKSLRKFTLKSSPRDNNPEPYLRDLAQMVNIESLDFSYCNGLDADSFYSIVKSLPRLLHIRLKRCRDRTAGRLLKVIGKSVGEQLLTLKLDGVIYARERDMILMYLARYFKSLTHLYLHDGIFGVLFYRFRQSIGQVEGLDEHNRSFPQAYLATRTQVDGCIAMIKEQPFGYLDALMGTTGPFTHFTKDLKYKDEETDDEEDGEK